MILSAIDWDPTGEIFRIFGQPILWYSVLFALGFYGGILVFTSLCNRALKEKGSEGSGKKIADRLLIYVLIGTVVGARLGHYLFYENPRDYLSHAGEILKVWNGGLASHGAVIAIPIAVYLYSRKEKLLTFWELIDYTAVGTALAAVLIRLGNFFNQEILGTPSDLPFAVRFGHPMDHSASVPRHPVVLYEAIAYLVLFFFLYRLAKKRKMLLGQGKLLGHFLFWVFLARFLIEFLKMEQSRIWNGYLTMGQVLSLPCIAIGIYLMFRFKKPIIGEKGGQP